MKRMKMLKIAICILISIIGLLIFAILFITKTQNNIPENVKLTESRANERTSKTPYHHVLPPIKINLTDSAANAGASKSPSHNALPPIFSGFESWVERYTKASEAQRETMLDEGIQLATARRAAMIDLIRKRPEKAINVALPDTVLQGLPEQIHKLTEEHVAGGTANTMFTTPGITHYQDNYRELQIGGRVYRGYVYGKRSEQYVFNEDQIEGVAMGSDMAVKDAESVIEQGLASDHFPGTVSTGSMTLNYRFRESDLSFSFKDGFDHIKLKQGTPGHRKPGTPDLPSQADSILLPAGALVTDVEVTHTERLIRKNVIVAPAQEEQPISKAKIVPLSPDPAVYASNEKLPAKLATAGRGSRQRGWTITGLNLNPVRYRPATKELYLVEQMTITLTYELPPVPPIVMHGDKDKDAKSVSYVRNPNMRGAAPCYAGQPWDKRDWLTPERTYDIPSDDQTAAPLASSATDSVVSSSSSVAILPAPAAGTVDYLVITEGASLVTAFTQLTDFRTTFNAYSCEIKTVSDIVATYSGVDTQAKIRSCIIDYVNNKGLQFVLIGGDNTIVNDRDCNVSASTSTTGIFDMPTDLYWAGLDSTWDDYDNDGIYGEYDVGGVSANDEFDLYYDVMVGRLPIRTAQQVTDYVNKVIAYETGTDTSVMKKFALLGEIILVQYEDSGMYPRPTDTVNDGYMQFTDANHPVVSDAERDLRLQYRDNVQAHGWNADYLGIMTDTLTQWDTTIGGDHQASAGEWVKTINEGYNFGLVWTHGHYTLWATESGYFDTSSAASLTGPVHFLYTIACLTAGFDQAEPCLSEAMIRNPNGGSLIYLGCSREGLTGTSPLFAAEWSKQIFEHKNLTVGTAFHNHKQAFAATAGERVNGPQRWIMFGTNLQGDPAIQIRGVSASGTMVSVAATDDTASETGSDTGTFTITRSGDTSSSTDVAFTLNGSATLTDDYTLSTPSPITFAAGETTVTITLTPVDDSAHESSTETATLTIAPDPAYTRSGAVATITIEDNDNNPPIVDAGPDQVVVLSSGTPWTPEFTTTLAWYDASDSGTLWADDGVTPATTSVYRWDDKSGNGYNLSQADGGKQPSKGLTTVDGKNVIDADGSEYIENSAFPFPTSGNISVIGIWRIDGSAPSSAESIFTFDGGDSDPGINANSTTAWNGGVTDQANPGFALTKGPFDNSTTMFGMIYDWDTPLRSVYVNGDLDASNSTYSSKPTSTQFSLMANRNTGEKVDGAVAEVIILDNADEETRQKIEGYLAHKWGTAGNLPVDHPYKAVPPGGGIATANLDGTANDLDNDPLSTLWSKVSGPGNVVFGNASAEDTTTTFTEAGTYVLSLTADDSTEQITDQATITVLENGTTFSFTYDGNGSDGGNVPVGTTSYNPNDTVTVLGNTGSLTKTGNSFSGWNTAIDGSGSGYVADDTFTITENITLYAQWTATSTYTLTVNNGTGGADYAEGAQVAISATVPGGQHFVNWTGDTANLADPNSASTTVTMPASTVTVTANFASGDTTHSADTNNDWSISQSEVESFITAYNSNDNTAKTANGDITAGRITMREVMRVIYLYNGGGAYIGGQTTVDTYDIVAPAAPASTTHETPVTIDEGDGSLVVSSTADSGVGSLRDAIAMAGHGETVIIDGSIDTITVLSEIVIDKSITIDGQGAAIVSGDKQTRIFRIENENEAINVTLKNMGIVDAENSSDEFGGAIYNNCQILTLDTVLFDGNANTKENGKGGAIYSSGTLNVDNCVFSNNKATEEDDVYSE